MPIRSFRDLKTWQSAMDLVVEVYHVSNGFPRYELFGLTSQLRRAATSVPSNIAEGYGSGTRAAYVHRLHVSYASLQEVETQLILAMRVGHIDEQRVAAAHRHCVATGKLLRALIASLADPRSHALPRPEPRDPSPAVDTHVRPN